MVGEYVVYGLLGVWIVIAIIANVFDDDDSPICDPYYD